MSNSPPMDFAPPDAGGFSPPGSVAGLVNGPEIDRDPCESTGDLPNQQAVHPNDDAGRTETRTRFYRDFAPLLRVAVGRSRGRGLEPEDAAQEAWLVLIGRIPIDLIDEASDVSPARIMVVIRNHLADLERRAALRRCEPLDDEMARSLIGREGDPATAHERGCVQEAVRVVIEEAGERLSKPSFRILVLRWVEGRTFAEISEVLEMPVAWVRDRHRRAIPVLRALLIRRFGAELRGPATANEGAGLRNLDFEEVMP
jgi:RNA polymerase sigma factor (sigma-70 family)